MTTFSVPIRDPSRDGRPIGVLGISVEIGDFDVLRTGAQEDLVASLVETRLDDTEQAGLILQHPALAESGADPRRFYHDPARVARLVRLRTSAVEAQARRWARRSIKLDKRQARGYLALAVSTGALRPSWVVKAVNATGRGV